jgi:hypothetical protein
MIGRLTTLWEDVGRGPWVVVGLCFLELLSLFELLVLFDVHLIAVVLADDLAASFVLGGVVALCCTFYRLRPLCEVPVLDLVCAQDLSVDALLVQFTAHIHRQLAVCLQPLNLFQLLHI